MYILWANLFQYFSMENVNFSDSSFQQFGDIWALIKKKKTFSFLLFNLFLSWKCYMANTFLFLRPSRPPPWNSWPLLFCWSSVSCVYSKCNEEGGKRGIRHFDPFKFPSRLPGRFPAGWCPLSAGPDPVRCRCLHDSGEAGFDQSPGSAGWHSIPGAQVSLTPRFHSNPLTGAGHRWSVDWTCVW